MRKLLLLVGAIVFVDTMFFAALTPLLPDYSERLDLSKAGAGVLAAAYPAGAFAGGIPGALAAVRLGIKPTIMLGLAGMAVTTLVFGFADSVWLLDGARFLQGCASAFSWTAAMAWIVAAAPAARRGEALGAAMGAAIFGALFGPAIGAAASFVGTAAAFSSVALLAAALAVWALRTPPPPRRAPQPLRALFSALRHRSVLAGVWFVALPALLFGVLSVLAPLRLDVLGLGAAAIGATFLVSAGCEAALAPLYGRLTDRRGALLVIRGGLVGSVVMAAALPWLGHRWLLAGGIVLAACAFGTFWTPAMSFLAARAESLGLDHAYGLSLTNLAWAPGAALGAAGGGALARATTDALPYLALAFLCLLTLGSLWRSASFS